MADISDLIQKLSYLQAGGKDPGQYSLDKINKGASIIDNTIGDVLSIKKQQYENQNKQASTGYLNSETAAKKRSITPKDQLGTPTVAEDYQMSEAEKNRIPQKNGTHFIIDEQGGKVLGREPGTPGSGDTVTLVNRPIGGGTPKVGDKLVKDVYPEGVIRPAGYEDRSLDNMTMTQAAKYLSDKAIHGDKGNTVTTRKNLAYQKYKADHYITSHLPGAPAEEDFNNTGIDNSKPPLDSFYTK